MEFEKVSRRFCARGASAFGGESKSPSFEQESSIDDTDRVVNRLVVCMNSEKNSSIDKTKEYLLAILNGVRILLKFFWRDKTLAVAGIIIGIYGMILTIDANIKMNEAEVLKETSQKSFFAATLKKISFTIPPGNILTDFDKLPQDKSHLILAELLNDVESQIDNQYVVSRPGCYGSILKFQEFLSLAVRQPEIFDTMGQGHSVGANLYKRLNSTVVNCNEL